MTRKTFGLTAAAVMVGILASGCSQTTASFNSTETITVAGHPYKTYKHCERSKPYGKFDERCDHPRLGYGGFTDPTVGAPSGAPGGFGGF